MYGQRYSSTGAAVGTEFQVNTTTPGGQIAPAVAALSDGGFVVTWTSDTQDGSGFGVYGQRYSSTGAAVGSEFQVNTTTFAQSVRLIRGGPIGRRLRRDLESYGQDGRLWSVRAALQQHGRGRRPRVPGQYHHIRRSNAPAVTALSDGGFVVTWTSNGQDGSGFGVYGQRYSSTGAAVGSEFQVNTTTLR